jgi:hypothetical protein
MGWLDTVAGFVKGVGEGAWDGVRGTVSGVGHLAEDGYKLATDCYYREQVWNSASMTPKPAALICTFGKVPITGASFFLRGNRFRDFLLDLEMEALRSCKNVDCTAASRCQNRASSKQPDNMPDVRERPGR